MAELIKWYNNALVNAFKGQINVLGTLKCMLVGESYVPNLNTHDYKNDITNEVSGDGYSAGGITLTGVTITNTDGIIKIDANDIEFSPITIYSIRYGVVYDSAPATDSSKPLIFLIDFDAVKTITNGMLRIQLSATTGINIITVNQA